VYVPAPPRSDETHGATRAIFMTSPYSIFLLHRILILFVPSSLFFILNGSNFHTRTDFELICYEPTFTDRLTPPASYVETTGTKHPALDLEPVIYVYLISKFIGFLGTPYFINCLVRNISKIPHLIYYTGCISPLRGH